jgi:hypothetical protein
VNLVIIICEPTPYINSVHRSSVYSTLGFIKLSVKGFTPGSGVLEARREVLSVRKGK